MQQKNEIKVTFSKRLSELLRERGANNVELARAIGLSHVMVGKYVNGESLPDCAIAVGIARYFGITVEGLLGETESYTDPRCNTMDEIRGLREVISGIRQDLEDMKRLIASAERRIKKI